MSAPKPVSASMTTVFSDNGACLGFVISRGRAGWEAYDANERSLGLFETAKQAANRLLTAAGGP